MHGWLSLCFPSAPSPLAKEGDHRRIKQANRVVHVLLLPKFVEATLFQRSKKRKKKEERLTLV